MNFGNNLTHWKENWSFEDEKSTPDRRFKTAPNAWERKFGNFDYTAKSAREKLKAVKISE